MSETARTAETRDALRRLAEPLREARREPHLGPGGPARRPAHGHCCNRPIRNRATREPGAWIRPGASRLFARIAFAQELEQPLDRRWRPGARATRGPSRRTRPWWRCGSAPGWGSRTASCPRYGAARPDRALREAVAEVDLGVALGVLGIGCAKLREFARSAGLEDHDCAAPAPAGRAARRSLRQRGRGTSCTLSWRWGAD